MSNPIADLKPDTFLGVEPDAWTAIGSIAAGMGLLVAAAAALIAALEYRNSRQVRLEQSRPYMTVVAEPSPASRTFIDIVIKNIGTTPARNLSISVNPPFERAKPDSFPLSDARIFQDQIAMWPPGHEVRAFFDSHIERSEKDMPTSHVVTLTYTDGHRRKPWSRSSSSTSTSGAACSTPRYTASITQPKLCEK